MIDVCAGIVTYNPDIKLLKHNIDSIINQVSMIIVVDNGSDNFDEISNFLDEYRVIIVKNEKNKGIAYALNQLCNVAYKKKYDWIITLDQDSVSSDGLVKELSLNINPQTAIIAPNIVYKNNEKYADYASSGVKEETWVITSASLMSLNVWNEINGFDDELFIDGVDKDYCIRAHKYGYKIYKDYNITLLHELGNLKCKNIFGKTIYVTNHNAFRKYYMARNAIYLDYKLKLNDSKKYIIKLITKILLFENEKIKKINQIIIGIKDAKRMIKKKWIKYQKQVKY